jgi:hypothetical protein
MLAPDQLAELSISLPPVISRTEVPRLLGGLISAGGLANLDSLGLGPRRIKNGRKVGYLRGDFIAWLELRSGSKAA